MCTTHDQYICGFYPAMNIIMYRDKIEHYRCDSTLLMKWRVCTLQGWCAIFNDIHGRIKPTDILIMCSAHK